MENLNTIRKHVSQKIKESSLNEITTECRRVLKELKEYPQENKNQIKYYSKFWILLSEY